MTGKSDEKYRKALEGIESRKVLLDHFGHSDFEKHLIEILKKNGELHSIILKVLFRSSYFWFWLFSTCLFTSVLVVKFPELAEWICSFVR